MGTTPARWAVMACAASSLAALGCRPAVAASPGSAATQDRAIVRSVDRLPNGLQVVVHEDHSSPIIAVNLAYHVGSANDPRGLSGLAHLVEHVALVGSDSVRSTARRSELVASGAAANAGTSEDRTVFASLVPTHMLEVALWLEADRMAMLRRGVRQSELEKQRHIVEEERSRRIENVVFGSAPEATVALLFPEGTPYHVFALGTPAAVAAADSTAIAAFLRTNYAPNNAVLTLAGDIDRATALRLARAFFGDIARGNEIDRTGGMSSASTTARAVLEDRRATNAQIRIAWVTIGGTGTRARPAFEVLAAALTSGRNGPLQRALTIDRPLAARVTAQHFDLERFGIFQIDVTARAGASLSAIEDAIDSVMTAVRNGAISETMAHAAGRAMQLRQMSSLQADSAKADQLSQGVMFGFDSGDEPSFITRLYSAYGRMTADSVRASLRRMSPVRVVLSMVPAGKLDLVSKPELPYVNVSPERHRTR